MIRPPVKDNLQAVAVTVAVVISVTMWVLVVAEGQRIHTEITEFDLWMKQRADEYVNVFTASPEFCIKDGRVSRAWCVEMARRNALDDFDNGRRPIQIF